MTELAITKGSVRIEGKIVGFTEEGSYREGVSKEKKSPYRSLSLNVKTSNSNIVYEIGSYGQIPDKKVKIYSNKGGNKQNLEIDFSERNNMPEGFTCFGFGTTSVALEKEDDKYKLHNYFNYDAVEVMKKSIKNDDSVWIDAQFKVEKYMSNGEEKTSVKYTIEKIGFMKSPIDFDAENFKEVCSFEHDIVILNTNVIKEKKKVYIGARIINFFKDFADMVFVVDGEKYEELAKNVLAKCKVGDVLSIQGKCINGSLLVDAPKKVDWGGESPEGVGKVNSGKISEFQITKVTNHQAKVYKLEDFVVVEKPKTVSEDPFNVEIKDEDLPW